MILNLWFKKIIFVFALLVVVGVFALADEVIVDFEEESLPVINKEFREIRNELLWEKNSSGDIELKDANSFDFQQKEAKQFRIENRTSDPSSPVAGEMWFRSDI